MNIISYEKLDIAYIGDVLNGLCNSMAKHEPMGVASNLESNDIVSLYEPIIMDSLKSSFIAKDTSNRKIVGAIICNDFKYFTNLRGQSISEKEEPIEYLLKLLENNFMRSKNYVSGKQNYTFYEYSTYVSSEYGNKGIASGLYKISEEYAISNGYKNIFTISTGPISQHIRINKLGFKLLDEIDYNTFEFNGITVFSKITQVNTCKSLIKILNS